jgi:pre-mRNA-processing factor 6
LPKAVECVYLEVLIFLAFAKLETYDATKLVINRVSKALPTEPAIWRAAAKLEETVGVASSLE